MLSSGNTYLSSSKSVIVIDDEVDLSILLKIFLRNEGYDAVSFSDPLIALEYFKETPMNHALLITDLRMPGLNGIDLAYNIRKLNSNIKIFLMTAFEIKDLENNPDFIAASIDKLLQKPFDFSELLQMINDELKI